MMFDKRQKNGYTKETGCDKGGFKPMKILFAASECVPFCKTGGLADVVGALAPVLASQGHDVRVIMPLYSAVSEKYVARMRHAADFEVELGWRKQYCGIEELKQDNVTWYFVDNKYYFGRNYVYGLGSDECERFGFFCKSVLSALQLLQFKPDILHAHDWQAGMIPALLNLQYAKSPFYQGIPTVFTIHNLQYQGIFPIDQFKDIFSLPDDVFTYDKLELFGCASFMKAGLVYSDEITTVSPSYAEEIQTAYFGERMDGLLRAKRNHLSGVLNGIDTVDYDPAKDAYIPAHYSADHPGNKALCKKALQEELNLTVRADVPVIGMVSRLCDQKGFDLIDRVITEIMQDDVQLVVLGMGEARYTNLFSWAEQTYPGRVCARFRMDNGLAHRIYAGCDAFLMPSRFEPCGLSQMISLRYGTVPIVRETGGLRDTVLAYNDVTGAGNGFSFFNYNAHDMLYTIRRALYFYNNRKDIWSLLQSRGMDGDYSWAHSASTYLNLYKAMLDKSLPEPEKAAPAEAEVAAPAETEAPAEPKKPVRKPRKKAADASAEGEATAPEAPAEPKKPARKPRKKAADKAEE